MPPVGRPPSERGVYSFEGRLVVPEQLVLESSFVVDALITSQARHVECSRFLNDIADARSTVIFNRFLEVELWETAYKIALKELHPKKKPSTAREDGRTLRRARTLRQQVETAWSEVRSALDWVAIELHEVDAWIPQMMGYGLSSYDAIHAATAAFVDVKPFVTLDYHFASVPQRQLQLWVPEADVKASRERRRRRG